MTNFRQAQFKSTKELEGVFYNPGVENAGVAFVKGANERNEFFEKINIIIVIDDEQVRKNKTND